MAANGPELARLVEVLIPAKLAAHIFAHTSGRFAFSLVFSDRLSASVRSDSRFMSAGEIFRSALSDVEQRELREEEARRIDVVTPVARAASSVGSGVVSVLERIFSNGSKDEEISKNLSQFAMRHPGAVALPSQSKRSKTDLDRLEDALDFDLETATGDAEVMKLDKDDML